jgi:hypothetical protein
VRNIECQGNLALAEMDFHRNTTRHIPRMTTTALLGTKTLTFGGDPAV